MTLLCCARCQYSTNRRLNFERHIRSNRHIVNTRRLPLITIETKQSTSKTKTVVPERLEPQVLACKYCDKTFHWPSGLSRHIKYYCKHNKDEDLKELVRLLNKQNDDLKKDKEYLSRQIDLLSKKLKIQNVSYQNNCYGNQNNGIQNNINILNHTDTSYDFLTDKDYIKCIKTCNYCVKSLIEKVHFNKEHPENMNIYISSMKTDYLMVYKDGIWNIVDRASHIDNLYDMNECQLETWYDEYKYKKPDLIESFERYLHNREDNEIINRVKKDILYLLYNKKNMVLKHHKEATEIEYPEDGMMNHVVHHDTNMIGSHNDIYLKV
jgi:hypothetical protein